MFCDTHCHILSEYYEDIDEILKESKEALITLETPASLASSKTLSISS